MYRSSSENATVKELLELVNLVSTLGQYCHNKKDALFMTHSVFVLVILTEMSAFGLIIIINRMMGYWYWRLYRWTCGSYQLAAWSTWHCFTFMKGIGCELWNDDSTINIALLWLLLLLYCLFVVVVVIYLFIIIISVTSDCVLVCQSNSDAPRMSPTTGLCSTAGCQHYHESCCSHQPLYVTRYLS